MNVQTFVTVSVFTVTPASRRRTSGRLEGNGGASSGLRLTSGQHGATLLLMQSNFVRVRQDQTRIVWTDRMERAGAAKDTEVGTVEGDRKPKARRIYPPLDTPGNGLQRPG